MKNFRKYTDTELFLGSLNKNPTLQSELFHKYSDKMYALCLRFVKETAAAEDVLIVGFMKVFDHIHQYQGTGTLERWIRKIMTNECLMYLEKDKNLRKEISIERIVPLLRQTQPSDDLAVEDLMKLINSLPVGYRTIFNLYAIEGFSHHEIAKKLKISENTSKSQLSRARIHLQKMIICPLGKWSKLVSA